MLSYLCPHYTLAGVERPAWRYGRNLGCVPGGTAHALMTGDVLSPPPGRIDLNTTVLPSHLFFLNAMDAFLHSDCKQMFIEKRKEFKLNPTSLVDLEAYDNRDNTYNYTLL